MNTLISMFGTAADLARAIGAHRAAVFRWASGERPLLPQHQREIVKAGLARHIDPDKLVWATGVARCPCCDCIIDDEIRGLVMELADK